MTPIFMIDIKLCVKMTLFKIGNFYFVVTHFKILFNSNKKT